MQGIDAMCFHPTEPVVVLFNFRNGGKPGIYLVDIPSDMLSLDYAHSPTPARWDPQSSLRVIKPRHSLRVANPSTGFSDGEIIPVPVRAVSGGAWILDLVVIGRHRGQHEQEPHGSLTKITKASLDVSNLTFKWESELPEHHMIEPNVSIDFFSIQRWRLGESMWHFDSSNELLVVPKFDNGNGHGQRWVDLVVPRGLLTKKKLDEGDSWPARIPIFELETGKLYVLCPEGLHVLQY